MRLSLVDLPAPVAGLGEAVIEIAYCGICGSDLHSFQTGFVAEPGQVLGHEFSGTVVEAPGVDGLTPGTRVTVRPLIPCGHCPACRAGQLQLCEAGPAQNIGYGRRGAFAEQVLVPQAIVGQTVFKLPDGVDDRAGALVEPLAVGLHAVRQAEADRGQLAVVLGAGPIGLAVCAFLRLAGVDQLLVADPSPLRREAARRLGADVLIDPLGESTVEAVARISGPGAHGFGARADVVIDCAGGPSSLPEALRIARSGAVVVLCAMYGRRLEVAPDLLTMKEITLRGSFGYNDEFAEVIDTLAAGLIDAGSFISHELALSDIDRAFQIQGEASESLKVLVAPRPRKAPQRAVQPPSTQIVWPVT